MVRAIQYIVVLIMFTSCYVTNPTKPHHVIEQVIMIDTSYNIIAHLNLGNTCFFHHVRMEITIDTLEIDVFY